MNYETGTGKYEALLTRCANLEPVGTAVVHPCEITALEGAVEAAAKGLIAEHRRGVLARRLQFVKALEGQLSRLAPSAHVRRRVGGGVR